MDIDGQILEGGGQILRVSVAQSLISRAPIRIKNIRAGRKQPGLSAQHVESVQLSVGLTAGRTVGNSLRSCALEVTPGTAPIQTRYTSECGTAGAISLIIQAALPILVLSQQLRGEATAVLISGGTSVDFSPPIDHVVDVLLPLLRLLGFDITLDIKRRGSLCLSEDTASTARNCHNLTRISTPGELSRV
jgi:RNA 3'-terminal phosphate cyclase (ATP)